MTPDRLDCVGAAVKFVAAMVNPNCRLSVRAACTLHICEETDVDYNPLQMFVKCRHALQCHMLSDRSATCPSA